MISIKNLYVSFTKEFDALHNINLEIENEEKVALVGESASGKTTLLRVLAKLEGFKKGEIYIDGTNINKISYKTDKSIAYVPKSPVFMENKTVLENLQYVLKIRNFDMASTNFKILSALNNFEIDRIKNLKVKLLNTYQKMLVQLARISLRKAEYFLIDNIIENLDDKETKVILSKIKELIENNPKSTFICSFTEEDFAKGLNLRVIKLKNGSVD